MNEIKPEAYLHIVKPIANNLRHRKSAAVGFEDMVGAGNLALVLAAKAFDPERQVPFERFASSWVVGIIKNYIRDKGGPAFKPTRPIRERWTRILQLGIQDMPDKEIAKILGCSANKVREARDGASLSFAQLDLDVDGEPAYEIIDEVDWTAVDVKMFLDSLSPRDREIVELRMQDLGQRDIARLIGVSQVQISRILRRIGAKYLKGGEEHGGSKTPEAGGQHAAEG